MAILMKSQLLTFLKSYKFKKIVVKSKRNPLAEFEVYRVEFDEIARNKVILKASRGKKPSLLRQSVVYLVSNFLEFSLQNDYPIFVYLKDIPVLVPAVDIEVKEDTLILKTV